jgi:hypothetical protein
MSEFPPPRGEDRKHAPDDAPFLVVPERRRRGWLIGVVAAAVLASAAIAAVALWNDDATEAEGSDVVPAATLTTALVVETTPPTTVPPTTAPPTTIPAETTVASAPPADGPIVTEVLISPGNDGGNPFPNALAVSPGVIAVFPVGIPEVCLFWNVTRMVNGTENGIVWTRDGQVVRSYEDTKFPWDAGDTVRPNWCLPMGDTTLEPGMHHVEYMIGGVPYFVVDFKVA